MTLRPVQNPPDPWSSVHREMLEPPGPATLEIFEERVKSILSQNHSPDVGFRWSLNPYRGCAHACAYCYARPTHQYWSLGAGTDFDRKIIVKVNAPERLEETLARPSWKGETIVLSGNTDCYQPLEARYALTRRCLEVALRFRNPVGIITKSALVRRDADVLARLAREARCHVDVSVPFADEAMARALEPGAPAPRIRLETIARLAQAGVPVGVAVAPIIPGVNDDQIAAVLRLARDAGATRAFRVLLRLPAEVEPVFFERLAESFPTRVSKVRSALRAMHGGALKESAFGRRMSGTGQRWQAVEWVFERTCRSLGLASGETHSGGTGPEGGPRDATTFRRPGEQLLLFPRT